jgi:ribosomal protein S18 acetylase RimI-like enzyme
MIPADLTPPPGIALRHVHQPADVRACFHVIALLRSGLRDPDQWTERALDMRSDGYRMLAAFEGNEVVGVAGYRTGESLVYGRFIYVDDLVTALHWRRRGLGHTMLTELSRIGVDESCALIRLDTAISNLSARQFYASAGLTDAIVGFVKPLGESR